MLSVADSKLRIAMFMSAVGLLNATELNWVLLDAEDARNKRQSVLTRLSSDSTTRRSEKNPCRLGGSYTRKQSRIGLHPEASGSSYAESIAVSLAVRYRITWTIRKCSRSFTTTF